MGRKINLSHLSEEECEKILQVIQRDFDLREREKERLELVEGDLKESEATEQVRAQQRRYNEKHCIRCCSAFNFLFNKKLSCSDCHFNVCKDCATWQNLDNSWICSVCIKQRALREQSCEWFYDHIRQRFKRFGGAKVVRSLYKRRVESDSENDSGYDPSTSVCSRDSSEKKSKVSKDLADTEQLSSVEIHQHIEALVEGLVGDALDNAHINQIYKHPEYQRLFHTYKGRLSEAITQLYDSLDAVINSKPNDSKDVTPTSAHVALKHIICEVVDEAMKLPCLQDSDNASACSPTSSLMSHEDDLESQDNFEGEFSTYEDILASAILNKVVEQYQKKTKNSEETGTDTDDLQHSTETVINNNGGVNMTKMEHENIANNNLVRTSVDVGIQSDVPSEFDNDSCHQETSSLEDESAGEDFSWALHPHFRAPSSLVIEEQIEEITETYDSESEKNYTPKFGVSPPGVNEPVIHKSQVMNDITVPELDYLYSGLDFVQSHKVPFPEFGMDIVEMQDDASGNSECDTTSTVITPIESWEDNWLFRKQKKAAAYGKIGHRHLGRYDDPICMLIPNPSDPVMARIGTLDIDELSDLSEQNSVGSIEFSPSEESGDEEIEITASQEIQKLSDEIISEFSQKDLEYTIDYYKESDKLHHSIPAPQKRSTVQPQKHSTVQPQKRSTVQPQKLSTVQPQKHSIIQPQLIKNTSRKTQEEEAKYSPVRKTTLPIPKYAGTRNRKSDTLNFVSPPDSVVVHSGKTARVFAQVKGNKPIDVAWFHNESLINDGGRFQVYWCGDHKFCLDIFDTDQDDCGAYTCVAFNHKDEIWADFNVRVKSSSRADNHPQFITTLDDQTVKEGSSMRVSCKVDGYPEPQVVFFFKNKRLRNNEVFHIDNLGYGDWTMEIKCATLEHCGQITACARNKVGEAKCSCLVRTEPDNSKRELERLTKRVNEAQAEMEEEANSLLITANQLSLLSDQINIMDNNMKNMETLVVQRTWEERQNELKRDSLHLHFTQQAAASALRRTTGKALDVISSTDCKTKIKSRVPVESINSSYAVPPKPGTIADREHKKWLQADVPMPNNPYTPENLAKRRDSLVSPGLPCIITSGVDEVHDVKIPDSSPQKIDCGLKRIETERYQRDYYINRSPVPAQRTTVAGVPKPMPRRKNALPKSEETQNTDDVGDKLNLVEEKVYVSAGKVYSLEDRIKQLESQVQDVNIGMDVNNMNDLEDKIAITVAQVQQNDKNVSRVEEEVARIRNEVLQETRNSELANNNNYSTEKINNGINANFHANDFDDNCSSLSDDNVPTLPSVKELASKFRPLDNRIDSKPVISNKSKEKIPHKDVILVEKCDPNYNLIAHQEKNMKPKSMPDYKVHSLTARMVSKEFREQVRLNYHPKQTNRTLCIPSDEITRPHSPAGNSSNGPDSSDSRITSPSPMSTENFQHGYTSDESTTSSNSLSHTDKPRRKATRSILNRATYWEKRAEQGLLSDCSVNDDFPKVDCLPE